jgi:GNAT superfamily N-acetyltransferase
MIVVRPARESDREQWRPLWDGYNAFYGRAGETALAEEVTRETWRRFFDPAQRVLALVAEDEGELVGLAHALYHPLMARIEPACYLSDLFTRESRRGRGIGRALIEAVCVRAKADGACRVYWQTQATNVAGRALYDQVARHNGFIVYSREL